MSIITITYYSESYMIMQNIYVKSTCAFSHTYTYSPQQSNGGLTLLIL